jgi:hypothetical protein
MEARQRVEVTGVFAGNTELGSDAQGAVAQRAGGWRVEVTAVLVGGVKLANNVKLGSSAQRAG